MLKQHDNTFKTIITAETITDSDKESITQLLNDDPSLFTTIHGMITSDECTAVVCAEAIKYDYSSSKIKYDFTECATHLVINHMNTATAVLRLAVALCKGDVSLKTPTVFNLSDKDQKSVAWLFNNINIPTKDMLPYKQHWIKLTECIGINTQLVVE